MSRRAPAAAPTRQQFRDELQAIYARVPGILCKGRCADSCTRIDATSLERALLAELDVELPPHIPHQRHLELIAQGDAGRCPGLSPLNTCSVYADRPLLCRTYGTQAHHICEHGCMPDRFVGMPELAHLVRAAEDVSRRWIQAGRP